MSDESKKVEATASEAEAQHMAPPCPGGFHYTVQPGDSMYTIAQKFGVSLDELIAANPQVKDPNLIYPGQVLCIPKKMPVPCPGGFYYTVQPGDSMYSIAQKFGISLNDLIAANPQIKDPNLIYPGQVLCIPKAAPPGPPIPCPGGFYYTVQPGDTMYTIAQRFGVNLNDLIAANPQIKDPNLIYPGQVLCIPKAIPPGPPVPCPHGFMYVVKPGDTLSSIASRFGTTVDHILAANPQITDPNLIYPGQRICIPVIPPVMPRRHCFIMHPTHLCPGAMGIGMIDIEKRELLVVARGIPDPQHFGMDHVVFMVRYREMEEFKVVEMMPMAHGMMMCHHMMDADMDKDPVLLIGAARRFPFVFGPLFLGIVVPIII